MIAIIDTVIETYLLKSFRSETGSLETKRNQVFFLNGSISIMIHQNLESGSYYGVSHNSDNEKVLVQLQEREEQVRCAFSIEETEALISLLQKHLAIVKSAQILLNDTKKDEKSSCLFIDQFGWLYAI